MSIGSGRRFERAIVCCKPAKLKRRWVTKVQLDLRFFAGRDVLGKIYSGDEDVIICEGDSWFDHPFLQDIPTQLYRAFRYCVLHSNQPGKLLNEIVSTRVSGNNWLED